MPVYEYTALDKSGKSLSGIVDADSMSTARQKLRGKAMFPVELKETRIKQKGDGSSVFSSLNFFTRVKTDEINGVTRQLSTLLGAGIPLVAALDALIQQTANHALKSIIAQIKEAVNEGNSLTFALSRHPKLFSNIYINMVKAGEASGSLDVVLDRLADFGEHQQVLRGRFKAALVYPIFMAFIGTAILFFLMTFIVPNITQIFTEMHQALPLPTLLLMAVSRFLKSFWWAVLLILAAMVAGIREFIRRPKGSYMWDEIKLRLPIIGAINRRIALARFGRTMGSLLQSGVPLLSSLQIVRNIVNNAMIAEVIDNAVHEIREGKSLNSALANSSWFPAMLVQMIAIGEQSGELESMLNKVADAYEREVESHITAMTSMLEPIMILFMGLVVGFIVISILLPIFEMNQMIK